MPRVNLLQSSDFVRPKRSGAEAPQHRCYLMLFDRSDELSSSFGGRVTWRLPGYARQVREPWPGFSTGLLSSRKGIDIPVDSPAGLSTTPHRRTGELESRTVARVWLISNRPVKPSNTNSSQSRFERRLDRRPAFQLPLYRAPQQRPTFFHFYSWFVTLRNGRLQHFFSLT